MFRGEDVRVAPFEGHFMRYEGADPLPPFASGRWRQHPDGWYELWPREALSAWSMEEAQIAVAPLLHGLEDGSTDHLYDRRRYVAPPKPEKVAEIEHATYVAKAVIARNPDGVYECHYFVYAPNGVYLPAGTPSVSAELDWEWGVTWPEDEEGKDLRTLADDPASAEQIARAELDAIVAKDPRIRRRDALP